MHAEGVLGLAHYFDDVSGPRPAVAKTFLRTFFEQHPYMKKEFSIWLSKAKTSKKSRIKITTGTIENTKSSKTQLQDERGAVVFGRRSSSRRSRSHVFGGASTSITLLGSEQVLDEPSYLYGKRHYMEQTSLWITSVLSLGWATRGERQKSTHETSSSGASAPSSGSAMASSSTRTSTSSTARSSNAEDESESSTRTSFPPTYTFFGA
ncbi:unnamed protein product [Amoebophrya sp. A25]|nr:unnamed protein product [Amoebophrya sp. A25]|eukprot:GSA25T00008200001.1